MKHPFPKYPLAVAAAVSASLVHTPAVAQGLLLEEIIVTAQKRETSLSDTPIAITALTSDQLKSLGLNSQQDIANITPSMSYQQNAGGGEGNRVYLRGIGRETNTTGTEPGVGVYDNGFYTNEAGVMQGSVDRIERIEILRGPQGTLFGRNTTAGAISVTSKKPGDEYDHNIRVRAGNYNATSVDVTSSGPITDNIGYLIHYSQTDRDSFFNNVSGPDPKGIDSDYVEAQLDFDFSDNINWNFRYTSASFDNETLERAKLDGYRNEPGAPSKLGEIVINPEAFAPLAQAPAQTDPFNLSLNFRGFVGIDDQEVYQSTLTFDFEAVRIRLLNGHQKYTWYGEKDFDGTASPVSYLEKIGQAEKSTQHELQFISNGDGNVDWVVGLFYFENESNQPYTLNDPNNPFLINNISGVANPDGVFYHQRGIVDVTSKAIYSQFDWHATDRLTLSAGLRYSEDEKEGFETQDIFYDSGVDFCGEAVFAQLLATNDPYGAPAGCTRIGIQVSSLSATHNADWDAVNWRLNATYDLSDDSIVYATVSTGYKSGGFRLGGLQDDPATEQNESVVDNEELTAIELGYKGSIAESLSVSASAFFYDYEDMQVELDILDPRSGIVTSRLANAPAVEIVGLELETIWAATDNLTLMANYSYLESEFKDDFFVSDNKDNQVRNVVGNEMNRTPNNKLSLVAHYLQPFSAGDLSFTANYSFIDDQFITVFNDAIETVGNYTQLNTRVSWEPSDGGYEVAVFANNLTDTLSYANSFGVSALVDGVRRTGTPISPRTYGLEVAVHF